MCSLARVSENFSRTGSVPRYLAFLPKFVFLPDALVSRYIVRGSLLSILPSLALAFGTFLIFYDGSPGPARSYGAIVLVVGLVLAAPVLETLAMAPPLR